MTRDLLIGKNRRATQKARRPKDFCLSITPAAFERKLGRGWDIFCPGHDFRHSARPLLEVAARADFGFSWGRLLVLACVALVLPCRADFTASDSDTLYDIYSRADAIADDVELIKNRSADWAYIRGHLQEIDDALGPGGGVYVKLASIDSAASSASSRLANIESSSAATANGISSLSDMLDSRLLGISNAIASIPRCNVVLTNFLNASGDVDMGIVTNIAEFLVGGSNLPFMNNTFFARFLAHLYGISENDALADFEYLLANSPVGFVTYLWASALLPRVANDPFSQETSWPFINQSVAAWSGIGADWEAEYTIFDAYNTLALGRMTNQLDAIVATNSAIYRTLQGWNNFDFHAKVAISNTLNAILAALDGDITVNQSQSVSTIVAVTNILKNSLGSSDDVVLDYEEEHDMPQWEPDYQESADENTNEVLYADASRYLTESMYQGKTNALGNIYSSFDRDPKRLDESLHFGGFNPGHGHGYLGGWTMKIGFAESSSAYQEVKRICRSVFDTILFVAHLCVFFIFSRRIVKFVTKPFPV